MKVLCPTCRQYYETDDRFNGHIAKCNNCNQKFRLVGIQTPTPHVPSIWESTKLLCIIIICCVILLPIAAYKNMESADREVTEKIQAKNKKLITEAILAVAKYPASSEVVIQSFDDKGDGYIYCSGYADLSNGFGTKTRYDFWFSKISYTELPRKFFGLFGGQKMIEYNGNLGTFSLTPPEGYSRYFNAGTGKEISAEDVNYD